MAIQCVPIHEYHEGIAVLQGQIEQIDDDPPVPSYITQHLDLSSVFVPSSVTLHSHCGACDVPSDENRYVNNCAFSIICLP